MNGRLTVKPVAFLVFNRPDTTARVFEAIRQARPPKLLVVADGPRADRPGEAERCAAVRRIIDGVDWPCKVLKNYSGTNLGCKHRISSGLNWVFETVEEAIILEDDCLPHPTFFRFCEELLDRFRNDDRVSAISGDNFQFGKRRTAYSYYLSRYSHIWGWATWKRVWDKYDVDMLLWPEIRDNGWLNDLFADRTASRYWGDIFERTYAKEIDTWDYQLFFSTLIQGGLTALPNSNLVANIGFEQGGTHTTRGSYLANLPVFPISFPLKHPPYLIRDDLSDRIVQKTIYSPNLPTKVCHRIGLTPDRTVR